MPLAAERDLNFYDSQVKETEFVPVFFNTWNGGTAHSTRDLANIDVQNNRGTWSDSLTEITLAEQCSLTFNCSFSFGIFLPVAC